MEGFCDASLRFVYKSENKLCNRLTRNVQSTVATRTSSVVDCLKLSDVDLGSYLDG
jgi:hypothetical protein